MRVVEYYRHCVHHGSKKLPKYNLKKLYIIDVDDLWPRKSLLLNTRITSHLSHDFIYYVLPVPNYHSRENNAFPHAIPALMNICRFLTKTSRVKLEIHFQSIINQSSINQSINFFIYSNLIEITSATEQTGSWIVQETDPTTGTYDSSFP